MNAILLICVIAAVALLVFRPAPVQRTQVFYMPVEVTETQSGRLGCLPVIMFVIFLVLVLGLIRW